MPHGHFQPRSRSLVLVLIVLVATVVVTTRHLKRSNGSQSCAARDQLYKQNFYEFALFGTYARLTYWAPGGFAGAAAKKVSSELQKFHDMVNLFDPDSELSQLNRVAVSSPFTCSEELWQVLQECRRGYAETNGSFDISVGPLMQLWGFHRKKSTLPTHDEIEVALAAVGLDKIKFNDEKRTVSFSHPDTCLDLGGVAKGYALDIAARITQSCGIRRGLIDLGGNIYCLGEPPPQRRAYSIGIRNPFDNEALLGTVQIRNRAVATSGNYEHYVTIQGQTIHHIIDPRTGYPVPDVASVTVVTPRGIDSDIYSTAIFVGGEELINSLRSSRPLTSILHVSLNQQGKSVIRRFGDVWEEF